MSTECERVFSSTKKLLYPMRSWDTIEATECLRRSPVVPKDFGAGKVFSSTIPSYLLHRQHLVQPRRSLDAKAPNPGFNPLNFRQSVAREGTLLSRGLASKL